MHSLTNIPTKASGLEIRGIVEDEHVVVVCCDPRTRIGVWRGHGSRMTDQLVGDGLLQRPQELRRMFADALATAIRLARDAGYEQAMADVRALIGVK